MPTTINGIGTHYYGKQNVETRQATCPHCGDAGDLRSYDTRLWFCVIFIPVIPLGKKRIIDECPRCFMHSSLAAGQWEELRANAIRETQAAYEADPESVEKAVGYHATLASGGEPEAAGKMGTILANKYGNNADVQLYLGGFFEERGDLSAANAHFHRAYEIDKNHAGAKHASTVALLREGQATAAKSRLEETEAAGQSVDPGIAFAIANALHAENDSAAAGELLKKVTQAAPDVQKEKAFRKLAKEVEKNTGEEGAIAAPRSIFQSPVFWWSGAAALVVVGLIVGDFYKADHQHVYVVNGLPQPLTVQLDEGEPVTIRAGRLKKMPIASGPHTAKVIAPEQLASELDFNLTSTLMGRWINQPVHVLDPTRSSAVVLEETIFSEKEVEDDTDFEIVIGQRFHTFNHADYVFEDFPREIEVKSSTKQLRKTRVGTVDLTPMQIVLSNPQQMEDPAFLDFTEAHLLFAEETEDTLPTYVSAAQQQDALDRCHEFLEQHLDSEPIDVEWHRQYQALVEWQGNPPPRQRYDALLAKQPDDAVRLYLRARLESYTSQSQPFLKRALQADPNNPVVLSAIAYSKVAEGKFEQALQACERALDAGADNARAASQRELLLIGLDQHEQLEAELEDQMKEPPFNFGAVQSMITSLASRGRLQEAEQVHDDFVKKLRNVWPEDPHQLALRSAESLHRLSGDLAAAERDAGRYTDEEQKNTTLMVCALMRKAPDEAARFIEQLPQGNRSNAWLWTSLASLASGDKTQAAEYRKRAVESYRLGSGDDAEIAKILAFEGSGAQRVRKGLDLEIEPAPKAAILLLLADEAGAEQPALLMLASRLARLPHTYQPLFEDVLQSY